MQVLLFPWEETPVPMRKYIFAGDEGLFFKYYLFATQPRSQC